MLFILYQMAVNFFFFFGGGAIIESCEVDEFLHITYFFQQIYWLYIIDFWDVFL